MTVPLSVLAAQHGGMGGIFSSPGGLQLPAGIVSPIMPPGESKCTRLRLCLKGGVHGRWPGCFSFD